MLHQSAIHLLCCQVSHYYQFIWYFDSGIIIGGDGHITQTATDEVVTSTTTTVTPTMPTDGKAICHLGNYKLYTRRLSSVIK